MPAARHSPLGLTDQYAVLAAAWPSTSYYPFILGRLGVHACALGSVWSLWTPLHYQDLTSIHCNHILAIYVLSHLISELLL